MNDNGRAGIPGVLPFSLEEICFTPISHFHQPNIFLFILKRGLYTLVINHCKIIPQHSFEDKIAGYPLLENAHLQFYHIQNKYWKGSDIIDEGCIEIYVTIFENNIQWFFICLYRN